MEREETEFLRKIENKYNCYSIKLPKGWIIDYALKRDGNTIGFADVEIFTYKSTVYDYFLVSARRSDCGLWYAMHLADFENSRSLPYIIFARFADRDIWCKVTEDLLFSNKEQAKASMNFSWESEKPTEYVRFIPLDNFKEF